MDWLIEKIKNPIQRDAEFYYNRAAEMRYLGTEIFLAHTPGVLSTRLVARCRVLLVDARCNR